MRGCEPVPRVQAASTACPALDPGAIIARQVWTAGRSATRARDGHAGVHDDGSGPARVGDVVPAPGPRPVDGRPRRGDHAARARRLAGLALRGRAARAARSASSSTRAARRTGSRSSSPPTRTRTVGEAARAAAPPARRAGLDRPRARPARRGRRHASAGARRGRPGLPRRPLPVPALVAARARAARADLRPARARRGPRPRARRARLQRHARPHPGAARAGRQLAVHPRARQRPGVRPHAGLPGLPAHRHPARVRDLRRLRRGDRRADALRRDPRADVHLVGRAPAAQARARSRCA